MQIRGSKGGSINPIGDAKLIKTPGMESRDFSHWDKNTLKNGIENMMKALSPEEIDAEKNKIKEQAKKAEAAYNEWLKIDHAKDYVGHEPITDNHTIIRLFYYTERASSNLLLVSDETHHQVYPIAKVLSTNSPNLKPGDIVTIPVVMANTVESKLYKEWTSMVAEKPSLRRELPKPPVYIGKLQEWGAYMYCKDPFEFLDLSLDDQHTFCLRTNLLQTKLVNSKLNNNE